MGKSLGEILNNIMEENATDKILIMTENLHIVGTIHDYHDNCKNCHDCIISLKDVRISRLSELNRCGDSECACHDAFAQYKWFNISVNSIVGYCILGNNSQ